MKILFSTLILFHQNILAHGISESAKGSMMAGNYINYIYLGAEHMITGYDHLLFLLGVVFFLTGFKDIVKFITAFTLGHSITLIFATLMKITANYWLVDAVIALSVCYKGLDNNGRLTRYFNLKQSPNLILMVFIFGLIHGFGLSTRLQQLPLGFDTSEMIVRILSFNIGVEIGQIMALCLMLVFLALIRKVKFFDSFSKVCNDGLVFAGLYLFFMQMHGYQHEASIHDFPFDKESHIRHHKEQYQDPRRRFRFKNQEHGHDHGSHGHGGGHHGHDH